MWRLLLGGCVVRRSLLRGKAASPDGGAPVRGGVSAKAPRPQGPWRFCGVLGQDLAHPAYRREKTERVPRPAGRGVGILPPSANADERTRTAFRPNGRGWVFSARVKATAAAGGKIAPSDAIFALTPRRKHNILWSVRVPNTSSENSLLTPNRISVIIRIRKALAPLKDSQQPPKRGFGPEKGLLTAHGARVSSLFLSQKSRTASAGGRRLHTGPRVPTVRGGVMPTHRGETEASRLRRGGQNQPANCKG